MSKVDKRNGGGQSVSKFCSLHFSGREAVFSVVRSRVNSQANGAFPEVNEPQSEGVCCETYIQFFQSRRSLQTQRRRYVVKLL